MSDQLEGGSLLVGGGTPGTIFKVPEPTNPRMRLHNVPSDGQWHEVTLTGPVAHVAAAGPDHVALWSVHYDGVPPAAAPVKVFGDEEPLDCPGGRLVHLGTVRVAAEPARHVFGRVSAWGGPFGDQQVLVTARGT